MNNTITPAGNDFVLQPERKPTHFIELYVGKVSQMVYEGFLMPISLIEGCLEETLTLPTMETIAIWKIYPKQ